MSKEAFPLQPALCRLVAILVLLLLVAAGCPGGSGSPRRADRGQGILEFGPLDDRGNGAANDQAASDRRPSDTGKADPGAAAYFADVPPSHPFFTEIQWVRSKDIMNGCQADPPLFCPAAPTTRAQLAVALVRMKHGSSFSFSLTPFFTDVPATHWAFSYIQRLAADKVTSGCAANLYCPEDNASRAQAAVMLVRMKFGESFTYSQTPYFSDVPATDTSFKYIQKLKEAGITDGCSTPGAYCPADPLLRQQLAAMLYRAKTL